MNSHTNVESVNSNLKSTEAKPPVTGWFSRLFRGDDTDVTYTNRELARGYTISVKQVILAFAIELVIIGASLVAAWYFAEKHSSKTNADFVLSILGPIGFAMVEMTRIPLAISIRTHKSIIIKLIAVVGVVAAAGITAKSMVNLGQLTYEPRRIEVIKAHNSMTQAIQERDLVEKELANLQAELEAKKRIVDQTDKQVTNLNDTLKKHNCVLGTTSTVRDGQVVTNTSCRNSAQTNAIIKSLEDQVKLLKVEKEEQSDAEAAVKSYIETVVRPAESKKVSSTLSYREALTMSQLHSLAAILLGKDLVEVQDADVSHLLKYFVYIPAFLVAFASTLIAITAVHRIPAEHYRKDEKILLPENAGAYVFGPLASAIADEVKKEYDKYSKSNKEMPSGASKHGNEKSTSDVS